MTTKAARS